MTRRRHNVKPSAVNAIALAVGCLFTCLVAVGCRSQRDLYARSLVVHTRVPGKVWLASLGSSSKLMAKGRIDAARRIATPDGVWIDLWVIAGRTDDHAPSRGTAVLIHGLTESRAQMYRLGQHMADRGFDVVLPDLRAHGRSTGTYTTFGPAEAADLDHVTDVLLAEGLVRGPVFVVGTSLGGATAVHLGARRGDCRGVVAIAPVGDVRKILQRLLLAYAPLMGAKSVAATVDRAGEMAGFDVDTADSIDAAPALTCPLLVVHGTLDAIVPVWHGRRVYAAAKQPKRLEIIHWGGHIAVVHSRSRWIAEQVDAMARGEFAGDTDKERDQ